MPAKPMPDNPHAELVRLVAADPEATHLLQRANSVSGKHAFMSKLFSLADEHRIACRPKGQDPYRMFLSWCSKVHPLPQALRSAIAARKTAENRKRTAKRDFIQRTNLDWKHADRDAFISSIPVKTVKVLKVPFPPVGHHVATSRAIFDKWYHHFTFGRQPDTRKPRLPLFHLDASKLSIDVAPNESFIFKDKKGQIVGVVLRNFCPDAPSVAWADGVVERAVPHRKSIRMEDTGKLLQIGYSAGSRSSAKFDWVKNLLSTRHSDDAISTMNAEESSLFAFAWQQLRSRLPHQIIDNFDLYLDDTSIKRMDANGQLAATYSVKVGGHEFDFHDVSLAPPTGVFGQNYSRPIHHEKQPHKYAASWTLSRNADPSHGAHFYFAKYGIRVQAAPNTVIVWIPEEPHGTCLPNYHPSDDEPAFLQRGLAFVTSNRLPGVWKKYLSGILTQTEAVEELAAQADESYD